MSTQKLIRLDPRTVVECPRYPDTLVTNLGDAYPVYAYTDEELTTIAEVWKEGFVAHAKLLAQRAAKAHGAKPGREGIRVVG
jgi:hypothetical protein